MPVSARRSRVPLLVGGATLVLAGAILLPLGCTPGPGPTVTVTEPAASATSAAPAPSATPTPSPTATPTPTPTDAPTLRPARAPEIQGAARYRAELSFREPVWGPGRVDLRYQWLRDARTVIAGETGTTYRLRAADIGHRVLVRITGGKAGYPDHVQLTQPVGPIEPGRLRPATPEVSGSARVGRTLTGSVDPWGPGEVSLGWQWYRGNAKIDGATGRTYRLVAADEGHTIRLRIRGSAANFTPELRFSEPTGKVALGILDPTPVPLYSGTAKVGHTLTALPRQWGPGEVDLTYQWYRDGADGQAKIDGATKVTYKLVAADAGHRLRVRVSGSKPGFEVARKYSGWTSEIDPGDLTPGTPTIEGWAMVGRILSADPGEWRPSGVQFTYRWYRSEMLVTKAAGAEYSLSEVDVGHTITVRVHGQKDGYRDTIVESAPTDRVVARERR